MLHLILSPSNVTLKELLLTVVLAVVVCIVAGLLLATGFYQDFWAFWFSFVVATAHFSLIKVMCPHSIPKFYNYVPFCYYASILFHTTAECAR